MPTHEMDRHSGSGLKGDPKKGGAGGKFTWGEPIKDDVAGPAAIDKNDPNYIEPEKKN